MLTEEKWLISESNNKEQIFLDGFRVKSQSGFQNGTTVLIQGLGCESKIIWKNFLLSFKEIDSDRDIIGFDTRGIGKSEGKPISFQQIIDDTVFVLRQEKPPIQLVGHSLGGLIALKVAERMPNIIDNVVLVCSIPRYSEKAKSGFIWRADEIAKNNSIDCIFERVIPRSFSKSFIVNSSSSVTEFKSMLSRQNVRNYCKLSLIASEADSLNSFSNIKVPILMVVGSDDPSVTVEKSVEYAKKNNCPIEVIRNAGHNIPLEKPEELSQIIHRFYLNIKI
ncbi:alpha/beta fold hydrolase [uncultured Streptococcus sp.]|jgi:hypothetical protein|uniref:alpha/beta fold hydrolase n=1 Tax=uncultured Streptococcus sp. TaxID=83427 RepID=UPI0025CF19E5|nr:alpha/beta hydrolase [uncultured Streptococcus sp.]